MRCRLRIEADGGSRGNPGTAGYGAVVFGEDGSVLAERAAPLGKASNNVAEYSGLIAGLEAAAAIDLGAEITVAMDSKLVVEQMSGRWKIKHEDMKALALQARRLAEAVTAAGGSVRYTWIPRGKNSRADALSNRGMDGETIVRDHADEPDDGGQAGVADRPGPSAGGRATDDPAESEASPGEGIADEAGRQAEPDPAAAAGDGEGSTGQAWARRGGKRTAYVLPADPFPKGEPTRLVLVRHGVTALTESMRLDGRGGLDPGLSQLGREQAAQAARLVADLVGGDPATLTTSNLLRAKETGAIVAAALGVDPVVDEDWDEQNFGDWDGAAMPDLLRECRDDVGHLRADPTYARPGGETHQQLAARVLAAYAARVAAGGVQVIVAHRKPFMVVLADLLGLGMERSWRLAQAPGALTAVEAWPNGAATIVFTNRS
ncbi:MAG: histidine phosphatase family protein [Tetrasphaera sp.]